MPPKKKKNKQDRINRDQIEEDYGLSYALFKAFPELDRLLNTAVNKNWDPVKFQVELRQTEWFRKHSDVWREMTALKFSDPATFRQRVGEVHAKLGDLAQSVGVNISRKAIHRMAMRSALMGFDDAQIRNMLAKHVRPSEKGHYGGDLAAIESTVRETAYRNGVRMNRQQLRRWMQGIVRGNISQEELQTHLRQQASQQFPLYADQIRAGMDVMDIANPFINSMSTLLEINPSDVDLHSRLIKSALGGVKTPKGKVAPMSLSEFEDTVRQDKRWLQTDQAREQATEYALRLGEAFGVL